MEAGSGVWSVRHTKPSAWGCPPQATPLLLGVDRCHRHNRWHTLACPRGEMSTEVEEAAASNMWHRLYADLGFCHVGLCLWASILTVH